MRRDELKRAGYREVAGGDCDCEWCGFAGLDCPDDDGDRARMVLAPDGAALCGWGCAADHYRAALARDARRLRDLLGPEGARLTQGAQS